MKQFVKCTCGHIHASEFQNENEWQCIKKACCPVCTSELPGPDDPVWDDENYVTSAMTTHDPVIRRVQAYTPHSNGVSPVWYPEPIAGESVPEQWDRLASSLGFSPENHNQVEDTYQDTDTGIIIKEGYRLV